MSHNTWIHRVARVALVKPLIGTAVTPNHLTALRIATGVGAAGALAVGDPFWMNAGAGLFAASVVLDRADGDLARLTGNTTPWGHRFDLLSDALCNTLIFIGLGIGLAGTPLGLWAPAMGGLAGAAVAAILWLVILIEDRQGARAAELSSAAGFDADDAILAVPVFIWLGWPVELLKAAALGAPAFALFFFWLFMKGGKLK